MKRTIIAVLIFTAAAGGAFAQRNTVYGGTGIGFGIPCIMDGELFASYEFAIIPQISVGVSAAFQMYPMAVFGMVIDSLANGESTIKNIYGPVVEGQAHWYPFAKVFHLDLGLGYSYYLSSMHTLLIAPGLGWMIDPGKPGGFVTNIGLRVEIFALGNTILKNDEGDGLTPVNVMSMRVGFGYRF